MSDIDPFAGAGFFGMLWILSIFYWKITALILAAVAVFAYCWRSFRYRNRFLAIALILLTAHLADSVYFNFLIR